MKVFFLLLLILQTFSQEEKPVLVILQFMNQEKSFSKFINQVKSLGKRVEVVDMDTNVQFESYDEFNYDSVYILAPKYTFKSITAHQLKRYVGAGGNVFFAISQVYTSSVKSFLSTFKVTPEDATQGDFTTIKNALFKETTVAFKGVSLEIPKTPAFVSLLSENTLNSKYSNKQHSLVFTFQSLANGRLVISGSVELFSDVNFNNNSDFVIPLIQWAMQEHGKLILKNVQITKIAGAPDVENEGMFFINDTVSVSFDISQKVGGVLTEYNADDVMVEYRFVTPVISNYAQNLKNGSYVFTTVLPDRFGVYTILINYTKPLLSRLEFNKVTPIRPFRHDHVERFQTQCMPFYLAYFSMSVSTVIFVFFYLNYKENPKRD
ncbi:dolichyl-diphosphooligosaccharide--protein glycosyltransferase, putative [Entamoeba invadens IP1]|uniref:dolichyl-diphosphooligosaccharide--protein glycosyltransferase, putative n=1 Tax=Entamoeba invadens IP1 TaxID=370355 RepID=UPI0002C3ECF4|nr:dolichyl-diphosphooligosaccharide--protein glycosyltransferase, putative [Entamoeba invadens IP1]ELP93965.1 dolichyl-diphosphooligosaccharide--protein glycosyltransferase, putative [Entamoeba invadens IP1]|eukprot:XP_004260736.1 dolichyl-diphosphooligosaccharide--protein glycosyltransferase, putative [Entamoeba invadens IP1]